MKVISDGKQYEVKSERTLHKEGFTALWYEDENTEDNLQVLNNLLRPHGLILETYNDPSGIYAEQQLIWIRIVPAKD